MLIFISGSINAGKTTTSQALAKRLGAGFLDVDELNDTIPNFNLETGLDKSMDLAIVKINKSLAAGSDVVANYVVRQRDFDRLSKEVQTKNQIYITLAPELNVAKSNRGNRKLSDWEIQRIQYHYDTGIATPKFGHIIDNSNLTIEQTVERILAIIVDQNL